MKLLDILTPRRLWQQIGLAFAGLTAGALVILGFLLISASRNAVRDSVLRDYSEIVRNTASQLDNCVQGPKDILINTAGAIGALDIKDAATQKFLLYRLVTDYPHLFERAAIVSPDGKELASSDIAARQADQPTPQGGADGNVYFSAEHRPYITLSAPINGIQGPAGTLVAEVKLNSIWEIISKIKLGAAGE
ncbi:MAG: cache domain-containing protein, partial [Planctomycetota bacterium]